jgi:hypothetical protein
MNEVGMASWSRILILKQAADHWAKGDGLETGKLLFENLPPKARPKWAAKILKLVLDRSGVDPSPFLQVLAVADHEKKWKTGHKVFDSLRQTSLKLDELRESRGLTKDEEQYASIVSLAEFVAKVIYNATNPLDEFDDDSGWFIASYVRGFIDGGWSDDQFVTAAWSALCSCE